MVTQFKAGCFKRNIYVCEININKDPAAWSNALKYDVINILDISVNFIYQH